MRFLSVGLRYGALDGEFDLPSDPRPVLIAGPNGSGKSTLLESLPRTLFGFRRKIADDRERLERRIPWRGAGCRGAVTLMAADGRLVRVERDFETDEVTVTEPPGDRVLFRGEVRAGGSRPEALAYRELLRDWTGLDDIDAYRRTAWIRQGDLRDTRLTEALLRVAEGGHAATGEARERIRAAYYERTRRPLADGDRARRDPRRLEKLETEISELEADLAAALEAERTRAPLLARVEELRRELDRLDADLATLDAALGPLSERRALRSEEREARQRLARLEEAERSLDGAMRALRDAQRTGADLRSEDLYPDDFEERIGALRVLWEERERRVRERERSPREKRTPEPAGAPALRFGLLLAAVAGVGGGALAMIVGRTWIGGFILAVSLAALVSAIRAARTRPSPPADAGPGLAGELRALEERIRERTAEIPDGDTLTPETLPDRRREFARQRDARRLLEARTRALEEASGRARIALGQDPAAAPEPGTRTDAATLLEAVRAAASAARLDIVRTAPSEGRESSNPALPEGVAATVDAVEKARGERRHARAEAARELAELERRLAAGRIRQGSVALEDRLRDLREERARIEIDVEAHREAFRLLADAYDEFRSRDQERLADAVSRHLAELSGGTLGPLEIDDSLEGARLRAFDRANPIAAPPLSYGQLQAARLAVRLGAVDFLAGVRIRPPLLVDEPFAWLDEERAAAAWSLLTELARTRQVIVTSQDRLLLHHLGVEPDIRLARP
ncbi:MAG: ATP-binding protein [Gemmatimonadota bacterium]